MANPSIETSWLENAISDGLITSIDYNEFGNKETIIEGGNSFVYKSEWTNCRLIVALKSLRFDIEGKDVKAFVKEV